MLKLNTIWEITFVFYKDHFKNSLMLTSQMLYIFYVRHANLDSSMKKSVYTLCQDHLADKYQKT